MKRFFPFLVVVVTLWCFPAAAQHFYLPLNNEYMARYDSALYKISSTVHTSVKPYISTEVAEVASMDTIEQYKLKDKKFNNTWVGRKLFREHLLQVQEDDYFLYGDIDFEFDFGKSLETLGDRNCSINSRGITVGGTFGQHFSFNSTFVESQSTFSGYLDSAIRKTYVVPGSARIKNFDNKFDYGTAYGSIAYSLKKHFSFQFGHDKNFIGDGYRSMLLSDNSFNYPFFKINANFWKVKYMVLYTLFQDGPYPRVNDDEIYKRKYGTFHYLDINIGKRLTFGVLESIIWDYETHRGFDIYYLNPVIFLRPVEFSIGSPDNALIGFNLKYKLSSHTYAYGQLMLDEFKINEVRAGDGWWGNKQAFQLGFRAFSLFGIPRLDIGSEFNYARPYTYQHWKSETAYAHYNQPLAHPLGGNFMESVSTLNYSWKRWHLLARAMYAKVGYDYTNDGASVDSAGKPINYGNNVLLSYDDREMEFGNETLQGLETTVINGEFRVWYLVNPASNMVLEAGTRIRQASNIRGTQNTAFFFIGFRTNLSNRYFDF